MSRKLEIEQGLREQTGALIGGLDVIQYTTGWRDFENGVEPPSFTHRDYDLGRARAAEAVEAKRSAMAELRAISDARHDRVRAQLAGSPEILADYDRMIAEIRA